MSSPKRPFRKLSSWTGLFGSGAVFLDEHCLVSVRSYGFEEHVKRLFYKDIQALVISKSRRFGMSRRESLAVFLLVLADVLPIHSAPLSRVVLGLTVGLGFAWLYTAIRSSCRCRVYTAVSQEELISVRRSWTARKLLSELTPQIEAAQGALPAGWQASVSEDRPITLGAALPASESNNTAGEVAESATRRIIVTVGLVLLLLLHAVVGSVSLGRTQPLPAWMASTLTLMEAAAAVWMLIQNRRINVNLQRFGMAVLIFLGLAFYGQTVIVTVATAQARHALRPAELQVNAMYHSFREAYIAICLVLGITGALLMLGGPAPQRRPLAE